MNLWIENQQLCLINAVHEHFLTQTGKKSKIALKNSMGQGGAEGLEPRKTNTWKKWSEWKILL